MTKQVQDKDGNKIQVADDTPCHAGKNGAPPTLYTAEETAANNLEQAARKATWEAGATVRNAKAEIARLEGQVTQRRIREAIIGIDDGWLVDQDNLITAERAKLQEG